MPEVKRKSIIKGCKHESTSEGSVPAKNGDDLAFLACDECGTIFAWQRVKKEKDEKPIEKAAKVAEKPAEVEAEAEAPAVEQPAAPKASGRPTSARPKPSAKKPAAKKPVEKKEVVEAEAETPIQHSASFVLEDIRADESNAIFIVKNDKGKTFEVVKESTPEKATAVESAKAKYVAVTAIVVKYTAIDVDGLPTDGVFEQMVNITTK